MLVTVRVTNLQIFSLSRLICVCLQVKSGKVMQRTLVSIVTVLPVTDLCLFVSVCLQVSSGKVIYEGAAVHERPGPHQEFVIQVYFQYIFLLLPTFYMHNLKQFKTF
jgi:hypothetical protein